MQVSVLERPSSSIQTSSSTVALGSKFIVIDLSTPAHPSSRFTNVKSQPAPLNPQTFSSWREFKRAPHFPSHAADGKHNLVNKQLVPEMRSINISSANCSTNFTMATDNSIRKRKRFRYMANLQINRIHFFLFSFFLLKRNSIDRNYEHRTWMRSKVPPRYR